MTTTATLVAEYPSFAAASGSCRLCLAPRRDSDLIVDTGVDLDFDGRMCVCSSCLTVLGRLIGMSTPAEVEAKMAAAVARAEHAEAERDALAERVEAVEQEAFTLLTAKELLGIVADALKGVGGLADARKRAEVGARSRMAREPKP